MVKSKLSPLMTDMDISIDITKGGMIDPGKSLMNYLANKGFPYITNAGGWWDCRGLADKYPEFDGRFDKFVNKEGARYRIAELNSYLLDNPILYDLFELALVDDMSAIYSYQAEVAKEYRNDLYNKVVSVVGVNEVVPEDTPEGVDPTTGEILSDLVSEEVSEESS